MIITLDSKVNLFEGWEEGLHVYLVSTEIFNFILNEIFT